MEHSACTHSGTRRATAACEAASAAPAPAVEMTSFNRYRETENAPRIAVHRRTTAALINRINDAADTRPTRWH